MRHLNYKTNLSVKMKQNRKIFPNKIHDILITNRFADVIIFCDIETAFTIRYDFTTLTKILQIFMDEKILLHPNQKQYTTLQIQKTSI